MSKISIFLIRFLGDIQSGGSPTHVPERGLLRGWNVRLLVLAACLGVAVQTANAQTANGQCSITLSADVVGPQGEYITVTPTDSCFHFHGSYFKSGRCCLRGVTFSPNAYRINLGVPNEQLPGWVDQTPTTCSEPRPNSACHPFGTVCCSGPNGGDQGDPGWYRIVTPWNATICTPSITITYMFGGDYDNDYGHPDIAASATLTIRAYPNGYRADCSQSGQPLLTLTLDHDTINPSVPANNSIPNKIKPGIAVATVQASKPDGSPVDRGTSITIQLSVKLRSGGHDHMNIIDAGLLGLDLLSRVNAPPGPGLSKDFDNLTVTVSADSEGKAEVFFTAGDTALELWLQAHAQGQTSTVAKLKIGFQLKEISGKNLTFAYNDGTSRIGSHDPDGRSGGPEMESFLQRLPTKIAEEVRLVYGYSCNDQLLPIRINGIALQAGGLYDVEWDKGYPFQPPHTSHRIGNDVDIGLDLPDGRQIDLFCREILYRAIQNAGADTGYDVSYPEPRARNLGSNVDKGHYHVRLLHIAVPSATQPIPLLEPKSGIIPAPPFNNVISSSPIVKAQATFSQLTNYRYLYFINNNLSEKDGLERFTIQFSGTPTQLFAPQGWAAATLGANRGTAWDAVALGSDTAEPGAISPSSAAILPGQQLGGFSFEHPLPPTIRPFSAALFRPIPHYGSEEEAEQAAPSQPSSQPDNEGFTIGPRDTIPVRRAYIDDIFSLKQQAFNLGWIDDSTTMYSLDQKLQAAKQALSTGTTQEVTNTLTAFMQEVEAQKGKHLTSEAYALLFFNTQYLRDHRWIAATQPPIITTVAGSGVRGFSGDGGPATSAQLADPRKLAVDPDGNVFILDSTNYRVRRVDHSTGAITTIAGNGSYSGLNPVAIAVDAGGNLYILDGAAVRKVDQTGTVTTLFEKLPLHTPGGMAIDPDGNLYVADGAWVLKVDTSGNITTIAGTGLNGYSGDGGPATSAQVSAGDVALDGAGNIYIEERCRVRQIDVSGIITTVAGNGTCGNGSGDGGPALNAQIDAFGITIDAQGNLYIVGNETVRKVDSSGIIRTVAGVIGAYGFSGDGGPAERAKLAAPLAAAIDGAGNLYIADFGNQRIRKVTPNPVTSLTFQFVPGANNPPTQFLDINTSSGESWTAKIPSSCDLWLTVSPSSATGSTGVKINAYSTGLASGTYQCAINIQGTQGESVTVPVTLTVQPPIPLASGQWRPFGPYANTLSDESSGRVTALAVDPRDSNIVYAGPQGGGVWKTTNGGGTWVPVTDAVGGGGFAMTFITIDPKNPDTVYAGGGSTGEYTTFLKTTDGGKTWKARTGVIPGYFILSVGVSPFDTETLLAGTEQGVFLSTDSGENWKRVLPAASNFSVLFDSQVPSIAYASSQGSVPGIFRSTDSGQTWANISSGFLPPNPVEIRLSMTAGNSAVLYAGIDREESANGGGWLFKTTDHGDTWTEIKCGRSCPAWGRLFVVDPADPSYLIAGDTSLKRSLDGGLSWSDFNGGKTVYIHVDQHAAAFSHDGKILYVGNDGGVWSTSDLKAQPFDWKPLNSTLAISQIYGMAVHPTDPDRIFIGVQDAGILRYAGSPKWEYVACGDGYTSAFDAVDRATVYVSCPDPQVSHSGGKPWSFQPALTGIDPDEGFVGGNIFGIVADPSRGGVVYINGQKHLYQSVDGAASWRAISSFQWVTAIAVSPIDSNVVFAGTTSGEIFRTANALSGAAAVWDRVARAPNGEAIYGIAIDPRDGQTVFATVDGSQSVHVLKSTDAGMNFVPARANLPDTRVRPIIFDPDLRGTLYLGGEHGTFATTDGGNTWEPLGTGLPRSIVAALVFHRSTRTLYAAIYGRSIWTLQIPLPPPPGRAPFNIADRGGLSIASTGVGVTPTVGYASIHSTTSSIAPSGLAIFGSRNANGILVSEATVASSPTTQSGRIYAEVNATVNTGLAIANPNGTTANISFYFTDQQGSNFGAGKLVIPPNGQKAAFLDQPPFNGGTSLKGTFTFMSDIPVAAVALRGLANERSEFLWTTLPVSPLLGNTGAVVFPTFAIGEGWATQFILVNTTDTVVTGSLQFYDQGLPNKPGRPSTVTLDGQANGTFSYSIPPRSSLTRKTSGTTGSIQLGSVRVVPDANSQTPVGLGIFSFKNSDGITISQAGVPATIPTQALRLYAEATSDSSRIQTGIALANTSAIAATVMLDLYTLAGSWTGLTGTVTVPGNGQTQMFLNQVHGLENIPVPFQGILRISTSASAGVSALGLRTRNNERQEFIITTLTPINENSTPVSGDLLFPHVADGGGFATQFILFSTASNQTTGGFMQFYSQGGQPLNLTLR